MFLPFLRWLDLRGSKSLMRTPDFTGMPNLEYLNLSGCTSLKEVHHSLGCSRKLIWLDLSHCKSLERFPCVNVESLEYLTLQYCSRLEKFPEILGRMKPKLDISVEGSKMRRHFPGWLTVLDLSSLKNLVSLPSSIGMLISLVKLNISGCSKFESLSEGIGDLGNLESLDANYTLISQPPSSIIRLNKLKSLSFVKQKTGGGLVDGVFFVFPHVNEGLRSLEELDLRYCNLIDGGLPEDIGCLSSLKELHLNGNNFEHLPRSIAQLGALQSLDLSGCRRLKEFLGFKNFDAAVTWQSHVTPRGSGVEIWKFPEFRTNFVHFFSLNFNTRYLLHFESKLSDSKGKLQENFEGNLAVISKTRGEASFELGWERIAGWVDSVISAIAPGPLFLAGLGVCCWLGVPGSLFLAGLGADCMVGRLAISTSLTGPSF
ncbi:hypothetical protein KY285_006853 [Solanum tuberosum]|nr:hypothetical protein KY285_006853 [Solanum tuberosum]